MRGGIFVVFFRKKSLKSFARFFFIEVLLSIDHGQFLIRHFLYNRPSLDVEGVKKAIVYKLIFLIGRSPKEASQRDWLNATLHAVRDLVTEGWITTARQSRAEETRRVYYLPWNS